MTGKRLKEILLSKTGLTLKDIASRLGMSPQHLNQALNASDIKSGLLEKIAEILNVDMSFFYPDGSSTHKAVADSGGVAIAGNNNVTGDVATGNNAVLKERVAMLERLLDEKERLIQVLLDKQEQ